MVPTIFSDLLKQTMGLDAAAIGSSAIEHAVRRRMAARSLRDVDAYERCIRSSEQELQALIEAAVVPETWFFRDRQAFAEMSRELKSNSMGSKADATIRLLSLPCSTGEEPFSMAMTLLEEGFDSSRFRIDAIDISERALAIAENAVYGKNSFRGSDVAFRTRHFEATASGHRVKEAPRKVVHFRQANILAPDFLPQVGIYDIIFFRNLLIYFDVATRMRAMQTVRRLLTSEGTVFVGPAEAAMMFDHGFVWSKTPLAFAFRKKHTVAATAAERTVPVRPTVRPVPSPTLRGARKQGVRVPRNRYELPSPQLVEPCIDLTEATTLADSGRFSEAANICSEHLRRHGSCVAAFYLLGLIYDATGRTADAGQNFRKALYLDSNHTASLIHLALLLDKNGDAAGAGLLRERLQRQQANDGGAAR
jgi:chemotaxis protein methyltransferase WspC